MVERSVGVLWRTDGHLGEVQVVDGVGGDRGGDRFVLPLLVRLANQDPRADETKTHNPKPEQLCRLFPKKNVLKVNLEGFKLTFAVDMYASPCIVLASKKSFRMSISGENYIISIFAQDAVIKRK